MTRVLLSGRLLHLSLDACVPDFPQWAFTSHREGRYTQRDGELWCLLAVRGFEGGLPLVTKPRISADWALYRWRGRPPATMREAAETQPSYTNHHFCPRCWLDCWQLVAHWPETALRRATLPRLLDQLEQCWDCAIVLAKL